MIDKNGLSAGRVGALVLFAVALAASACGTGSASPDAEMAANTGSIGLALTGPANVILNSVSYEIANGLGFSRQGSIDVTSSTQITATIGGIPAGTGYRITLSATAVGGTAATCTGTAFDVEVSAGKTTSNVVILLSCQLSPSTGSVQIEGRINLCPTIDDFSITPAQTTVGHVIDLAASASDSDGGPAPLSYHWSTTLGQVADPTSPNTTFTCTEAGAATVILDVSDGDRGCGLTRQAQIVACDQVDDILATPGDDRAGYVLCSNFSNVSGLVCGPGTFCCQQTQSCVGPGSDPNTFCSVPYLQQRCDGPEDCVAGQACQRDKATICVAAGQAPTSYLCHTDSQCPVGWSCAADGHCALNE